MFPEYDILNEDHSLSSHTFLNDIPSIDMSKLKPIPSQKPLKISKDLNPDMIIINSLPKSNDEEILEDPLSHKSVNSCCFESDLKSKQSIIKSETKNNIVRFIPTCQASQVLTTIYYDNILCFNIQSLKILFTTVKISHLDFSRAHIKIECFSELSCVVKKIVISRTIQINANSINKNDLNISNKSLINCFSILKSNNLLSNKFQQKHLNMIFMKKIIKNILENINDTILTINVLYLTERLPYNSYQTNSDSSFSLSSASNDSFFTNFSANQTIQISNKLSSLKSNIRESINQYNKSNDNKNTISSRNSFQTFIDSLENINPPSTKTVIYRKKYNEKLFSKNLSAKHSELELNMKIKNFMNLYDQLKIGSGDNYDTGFSGNRSCKNNFKNSKNHLRSQTLNFAKNLQISSALNPENSNDNAKYNSNNYSDSKNYNSQYNESTKNKALVDRRRFFSNLTKTRSIRFLC